MTVERYTRTDRQEYFKFLLSLVLRTAARDNSFETRKHSSRMRTARLSTIASGGCVCQWGGGCVQGCAGLSLALVHSSTNMLKSVWTSGLWKPLIHTNMSRFLITKFFLLHFAWNDHFPLIFYLNLLNISDLNRS